MVSKFAKNQSYSKRKYQEHKRVHKVHSFWTCCKSCVTSFRCFAKVASSHNAQRVWLVFY